MMRRFLAYIAVYWLSKNDRIALDYGKEQIAEIHSICSCGGMFGPHEMICGRD